MSCSTLVSLSVDSSSGLPAERPALPSAVACASVSTELESVNSPPAWIVTAPIVASEMVFARLIAIAAATLTPPDEVFAAGVLSASPEPSPPFAAEVCDAKVRSCST